jgi:hypothetical protein
LPLLDARKVRVETIPTRGQKTFLCTGAFLYVRYSFLLISNKFCDYLSLLHSVGGGGGGGSADAQITALGWGGGGSI